MKDSDRMHNKSIHFPGTIFLWALLSLTILCGTSCSVYKEVEVTEVLDVQLTRFSTEKLEAEVFFMIKNPNWYKLKMTDAHIDLVLEGRKIAEVTLAEPITIPKKMVSSLSMKVKSDSIDTKALLANALTLMFKTEFYLEGTGYVKGKAMFVGRKVPVVFREKIRREDIGF